MADSYEPYPLTESFKQLKAIWIDGQCHTQLQVIHTHHCMKNQMHTHKNKRPVTFTGRLFAYTIRLIQISVTAKRG